MKMYLALLALAAPSAAWAADSVSLTSEVLVEHVKPQADGSSKVVREEPSVVTPGDNLVFLLSYRNGGAQPATGFVVTNPIPASVAFTGGESDGAIVSIDGGKSWGPLASLKVANADGSMRAATPDDVTHIRWSFAQPIAAGRAGQLSFRGVVK
ncbi:MAG TPA: hypothetical protein VK472_03690 [Allosphingosinicella sp.]|nr:hypothetical protein [Allosphingosinicella sp.]